MLTELPTVKFGIFYHTIFPFSSPLSVFLHNDAAERCCLVFPTPSQLVTTISSGQISFVAVLLSPPFLFLPLPLPSFLFQSCVAS